MKLSEEKILAMIRFVSSFTNKDSSLSQIDVIEGIAYLLLCSEVNYKDEGETYYAKSTYLSEIETFSIISSMTESERKFVLEHCAFVLLIIGVNIDIIINRWAYASLWCNIPTTDYIDFYKSCKDRLQAELDRM